MKYLVLILLFSSFSYAEVLQTSPPLPTEGSEVVPEIVKPEESPVEEVVEGAEPLKTESTAAKAQEKVQEVKEGAKKSRDHRGDSIGTVMVGYQLITSWLPSKATISYTHNFNDKWSLEGEYSFASIDTPLIGVDIGEIRERRFTLQARRFAGNSFNFSFGPVYSHFKARLGTDIVNTGVNSEFSAENLGISGGIGNRWQWGNGITFGVDWIRLNVPVIETKVEDKVLDSVPGAEDRDDIKSFIRTFNRIPTFVLFGLNLGYTF